MKRFFIFIIDCYKTFLSHPLKQMFGGGCCFYPTCSEYAKEAIQKYGAIRGGGMALRRFLKCNHGGNFQIDQI
jgi:putative membrane protein insertion efficiency factor